MTKDPKQTCLGFFFFGLFWVSLAFLAGAPFSYLLYGLMNEMALDNSHDIFLDGDHFCRISNLARKIKLVRRGVLGGVPPRREGARKTRPFSRLRDLGRG